MESKKLNIAILSGELPSTTFIERLIRGVAMKHRVFLFGVRKERSLGYNQNVRIYDTPKQGFRNMLVSTYRVLKLVTKHPKDFNLLLKEVSRFKSLYDQWVWFTKWLPIILYRPDLMHLQWSRDLEFYTFLKTRFHIPLVVSFRGAHINYTPIIEPRIANIYRQTFPYVDAFHAVSKAMVLEASKYGDVMSKTRIIYSPVPNAFLKKYRRIERNEFDIKKPLKIVSIGRIHWKKGYRYAIEAMGFLKNEGLNIEYSIIGASQLNEELLFLIDTLDLEQIINCKEALSQRDLIEYLGSQDILLLPSVEEGIANVVLEAMAMGLPVVSTNCGGMAEVIDDNNTGWLVPVRDPKSIAEAIMKVAKLDSKVVNIITENAHKRIKSQFDFKSNVNEFINLYECIVKEV